MLDLKPSRPDNDLNVRFANVHALKWLGLSILILIMDQLSKTWILKAFTEGESKAITSFFNLVLVYNKGAAFSFLSNQAGWQRFLFIGIAIIATVTIIYLLLFYIRPNMLGEQWISSSLSLMLGGALGNLIDRVQYGKVVDFVDFHWFGMWHYPAFNVADIAISLSVIGLIYHQFKYAK